jgi:hypothetical protein
LGLSNGQQTKRTPSDESRQILPPWISKLFVAFLCCVFLAITATLFQEGEQGALLVALIVGAALWLLEALESKRFSGSRPYTNWEPRPFAVAGIVALVAFIACLPTLNTYFLVDEFAFLHAFHNLSPAQFLQLLHMDMGQFVWGDSRQEFRPLYSLFYVAAYHLWSLHLWGYHLCLIFFHAAVSILVFLIAKALAPGDLRRAGLAGILFAVQPPHAQAASLIVGLVAESLPALLYLSAFFFFIRFRISGKLRSLAISIGAFAVCLLTKESAVTLPLMLFSYDLFQVLTEKARHSCREFTEKWKQWQTFLVPYVPFCILLIVYLAWRRSVLASYLRETNWGGNAREVVASPGGFWLHFRHLALRAWRLQTFNFESLFPYSVPVLGLVLGLFLLWALLLFRRRQESRRSIELLLYFGLVWYVICNLPYLIEGYVIYHLYLPVAGLSIAAACLAFPIHRSSQTAGRYSRLLSVTLLVLVSVTQMWKGEAEYARIGNMSARMTEQLAVGLKSIPKDELVVLWPANSYLIASGWGEEIVPYSVQPPFTPADLTSNIRIIEHPDMSCCGVDEWWQKIGPALTNELAGPPSEEVSVNSLVWNDGTATFKLTSRAIQRRVLADRVSAVLGGPPASVNSIDAADAVRLVKAITDVVEEGTDVLPQK